MSFLSFDQLRIIRDALLSYPGSTPYEFVPPGLMYWERYSSAEQTVVKNLTTSFKEACDNYSDGSADQKACWQGVMFGLGEYLDDATERTCQDLPSGSSTQAACQRGAQVSSQKMTSFKTDDGRTGSTGTKVREDLDASHDAKSKKDPFFLSEHQRQRLARKIHWELIDESFWDLFSERGTDGIDETDETELKDQWSSSDKDFSYLMKIYWSLVEKSEDKKFSYVNNLKETNLDRIHAQAQAREDKLASRDERRRLSRQRREDARARRAADPNYDPIDGYAGMGYSGWLNRFSFDDYRYQTLDDRFAIGQGPFVPNFFPNGFLLHGGLSLQPNHFFRFNIDLGFGYNQLETNDTLRPTRNTYIKESYISLGLIPSLHIPFSKKKPIGVNLGVGIRGQLGNLTTRTIDNYTECVREDDQGVCQETILRQEGGALLPDGQFVYLDKQPERGVTPLLQLSFDLGPVELGALYGWRHLYFKPTQDASSVSNPATIHYKGNLLEGFLNFYF